MSKTLYVYSTLSADNIYAGYAKGGADLPVIERQVLIKGGANVSDGRLVTPRGVVTKITEEEYDFLKTVSVFNTHEKNGFVTVSAHKEDPEKVIVSEGMESRDASSPLTPEDYVGQEGAKPTEIRADADDAKPQPQAHSAGAAHPVARQNTRRA